MTELLLIKFIKDHVLGIVVFFVGSFLIGYGMHCLNKIQSLEQDVARAEATIADLKTQKKIIALQLKSERNAVNELQALNEKQEQESRASIQKIKQALKSEKCATQRIPQSILDELRNS